MRKIIVVLCVICAISACKSQNETITIGAASSLTDVLHEVVELYMLENPEIEILFSFNSSGSIEKQIENGAPIDIFFSASEDEPNRLFEKNMVSNITDIVRNQLVMIAPKSSEIQGLDDLFSETTKIIAIGEPNSVPVGKYTKNFLEKNNIYEKLYDKFNFSLDTRQALSWVSRGDADCGFVYKTDVYEEENINVILTIDIDDIIYPICTVNSSEKQEISMDFIDFLQKNEVIDIFLKYNFSKIGE